MWHLRAYRTQPEAAYRPASRLGYFWPILYCACEQLKLLYRSYRSNYSDTAIRFGDPDFLKENNNLAIRRRFHAVTLTFDT